MVNEEGLLALIFSILSVENKPGQIEGNKG